MGRKVAAAGLLEQVLRDREFYRKFGEGNTFSRGEPLLQPEFLMRMLSLGRENGLHSAVDTFGAVQQDTIGKADELADMFLFDVKHVEDHRHREYTGA